ncbi:MAG: hypothetical protein MJE77_47410 [Proteobacteria bacterium]|nr:hypothetical protein [Pseudomonadota bacterium]
MKQLYLLSQLPKEPVVIPYSGGLDSFAQRRLVEIEQPQTTPLLIQAKTGGNVVQDPTRSQAVVLPIPVRHSRLEHAEPTYRTRTFLFGVVAAVAAKLSESVKILIGENGQGSVGASIIPFSGEAPFRTTHPLFTARLRCFLATLWGAESTPVFEHPNVWMTKGEVLQRLANADALDGWEATVSCSRNIARTKSYTGIWACGICGNCLLRRMSVHTAQLSDPTRYFWADLNATTLDRACAVSGHTTNTDENIANHSLVTMAGLADAAEWPSSHPTFEQLSFELACATKSPKSDVCKRVQRLIRHHQSEWRSMTSTLRSDSWVRQRLKVLNATN